jgi:thymidylate kinase
MKLMIVEGIDGSGKSLIVDRLAIKHCTTDPIRTHCFPTNLPEPKDKEDLVARSLYHLKDFRDHMSTLASMPERLLISRSFASTLAYQGFNGDLQDPLRYESLFRLGADAFFHRTREGSVPSTHAQVLFLFLRCDPQEANRRIEARLKKLGSAYRADDVDKAERSDRLAYLTQFSSRYEVIYNDLRSRLPLFYPKAKFKFEQLDVTALTEDAVVSKANQLFQLLDHQQLNLW